MTSRHPWGQNSGMRLSLGHEAGVALPTFVGSVEVGLGPEVVSGFEWLDGQACEVPVEGWALLCSKASAGSVPSRR